MNLEDVTMVWVDYKPVVYRCWYGLLGPGHVASTDSELVEFVRAMELYAVKLKTWFPNAEFRVAADMYSWRHEYLKNWWDRHSLKFPYESVAAFGEGFYYFIEGNTHYIDRSPQGMLRTRSVAKKDLPKELEFGDGMPEKWNTDDGLERLAFARQEHRRQYKSGRDSKPWKHATPKEEMNKLASRYALHWSRTVLGGDLHVCSNMEADDIVAQAVTRLNDAEWPDAENRVVICSSDFDLHQLCGEFVHYLYTTKDDFMVFNEEQAGIVGWEHVLCGDDSDAYSRCLKPDGKKITARQADPLIEDLLWSEKDMEEILKDVDPKFLERNMTLALLPPPRHGDVLDFCLENPADYDDDWDNELTLVAQPDEAMVARAEAKSKSGGWIL